MENLDRLFHDAERLKPSEGLWNRIAERAGISAGGAGAGGKPGREVRSGARRGHEWGWRMAASFAVGLGIVAALLVWTPGPGKLASKWLRGPDREAAAGGAEDFASQPMASAGTKAEQVLPDQEVLDWHADLGEVSGWDDDMLVAEPPVEE